MFLAFSRLPGRGNAGTRVTGAGIAVLSDFFEIGVDLMCPSEGVGGFVAPQETTKAANVT